MFTIHGFICSGRREGVVSYKYNVKISVCSWSVQAALVKSKSVLVLFGQLGSFLSISELLWHISNKIVTNQYCHGGLV